MDDFERELKEGFLEESSDLLENAESSFLELENSKDDPELINEIFRLAHNLKGTSRAVGFGEVAELTHHAENLILQIKEGKRVVTDSIVSLLLEFNDRIKEIIDTLKTDYDAKFDNAALIAKIEETLASSGEEEPEAAEVEEVTQAEEVACETLPPSEIDESAFVEPTVAATGEEVLPTIPGVEIDMDLLAEVQALNTADIAAQATDPVSKKIDLENLDLDDLADAAEDALNTASEDIAEMAQSEVDAKLAKIQEEAAAGEEKSSKPVVKQEAPKSSPGAKAPAKAKPAPDETLRVSLSRIEKLNNIVGELVILQTVLDQRRMEFIKDELSNKSIGQLGKISKEIQELTMSLRMVPVKSTFQKMTRIVRDTSRALDKDVELKLVGEETEIDKTVLEKIGDPLVHVVRNAVDHGLESREERAASGKSRKGNVVIKAVHEGSNLVIEVTDDGKGIHPDVIRRKAIEKGIIRETSNISDTDIIQYIFHAGFSTKEQVTEVSGRGVGMDVVKTNIEQLSGEVSVRSQVGKGSVFKIILPLTMAIIEGMIVKCSDSKFILPLSQVHEFVRINPKQIKSLPNGGTLFNLRDEVLPMFSLSESLKLKKSENVNNDSIAIIIRTSEHPFAVEVDDVFNQQQVVIKAIGAEIKDSKGYMGSSILGDGKPALIVDLVDMFASKLKENMAHKEFLEGEIAA